MNIDGLIENADWTKTTWDLPTDAAYYVNRYGEELPAWYDHIMSLPSGKAMPPTLQAALLKAIKEVAPSYSIKAGDVVGLINRLERDLERAVEEKKLRRVRDSDYWGKPVNTPITPGMKPAHADEPRASVSKWTSLDLDGYMEEFTGQLVEEGLPPESIFHIMRETRQYFERFWHSGFLREDGTAVIFSDPFAPQLVDNKSMNELRSTVDELVELAPRRNLTVQVDNHMIDEMTGGDDKALACTTTGANSPLIAISTRIAGNSATLRQRYGSETAVGWWPAELKDVASGKVILTHEWGHAITDLDEERRNLPAIRALMDRSQSDTQWFVSQYALTDTKEFIAESFALWFLTKGRTKSSGAQAMARLFKWTDKFPKVVSDAR